MYKSVNDLQKININVDNSEIIDYYLDCLFFKLNQEKCIACRTGDFKEDIKKLIYYSNRNMFIDLEDTYLINQLNRLINHIEYLGDFSSEAGKLTMIVAPLGIAYDIRQLYKKFENKRIIVFPLESLDDHIRKQLISTAAGIDAHKIEQFDLSNEEFEIVKNAAKRVRKSVYFQPYSCVNNINEFRECCGFDDCDLIMGYRLRPGTHNKNLRINELKELAQKLDKPVILVYHPNHRTIHKLELSSLKNLDLDSIDYIYGMLPGIEGYSKLK